MFNINGVDLLILIAKGNTQIYCMEDFLPFGAVWISYLMPLCKLVLWHLLRGLAAQIRCKISDSTKLINMLPVKLKT